MLILNKPNFIKKTKVILFRLFSSSHGISKEEFFTFFVILQRSLQTYDKKSIVILLLLNLS